MDLELGGGLGVGSRGHRGESAVRDDLWANWFDFMVYDAADMEVGDPGHTCIACGTRYSRSHIMRTSAIGATRVGLVAEGPVSWGVAPMADADLDVDVFGSIYLAESHSDTGVLAESTLIVVEGENIVLGVLSESSDAPDEVPLLDDVEDILLHLRSRGLDDLASDLEYKKCLIEEDPDELPISLESARGFADFVATESLVGSPNVMVDSYGYVGLEWIIPDPLTMGSGVEMAATGKGDDHVWGKGDGVLGLWFLPSGMVRVCGTSGPVGQGVERMRVNSTMLPGYVMGEVRPFLSRLEAA